MEKTVIINELKSIKKVNIIYWIFVAIFVVFVGQIVTIITNDIQLIEQMTDTQLEQYAERLINDNSTAVLVILASVLVIYITNILLLVKSFKISQLAQILQYHELYIFKTIGVFCVISLFMGIFFIPFIMSTIKATNKTIAKIENN